MSHPTQRDGTARMLTVLITTYNGRRRCRRCSTRTAVWSRRRAAGSSSSSTTTAPTRPRRSSSRSAFGLPLQILHQARRGQNAARNTGSRTSRAISSCSSDDDAVPSPQWLSVAAYRRRRAARHHDLRGAHPAALAVAAAALAPRLGAAQPDVRRPAAGGGGPVPARPGVRPERDAPPERLRRRPPLRRDYRPQGARLSDGAPRRRFLIRLGEEGACALALRGRRRATTSCASSR
jgi:hypothetical protein